MVSEGDVDLLWASLAPDTAGLVAAVVQHAGDGRLLMLGYMNREALGATLERGRVTFWSRSRDELWEKGATSGNTLDLVDLRVDCDGDALLVRAHPRGPTCHTGASSCFFTPIDGSTASRLAGDDGPAATAGGFEALWDALSAGRREPRSEASTPPISGDDEDPAALLLRATRAAVEAGIDASGLVEAARRRLGHGDGDAGGGPGS